MFFIGLLKLRLDSSLKIFPFFGSVSGDSFFLDRHGAGGGSRFGRDPLGDGCTGASDRTQVETRFDWGGRRCCAGGRGRRAVELEEGHELLELLGLLAHGVAGGGGLRR